MKSPMGSSWMPDVLSVLQWVIPGLLVYVTLGIALPRLMQSHQQIQQEIEILKENKYEGAWLDSVESGLKEQLQLLEVYRLALEKGFDENESIQSFSDRLRRLGENSGMSVIRTEPSLSVRTGLTQYNLGLEGETSYASLIRFLSDFQNHRHLYLERMSLSKRGEMLRFYLSVYGFSKEGSAHD